MVVLGFGLQATLRDVTSVFRRPAQLVACLVSMNVIMPLFAMLVAKIFALDQVIEVSLVALAAAPVPPILPNKTVKSGGDKTFSFGLLIAVSVLSLIVVPAVVRIAGLVFVKQTFFSESSVLQTISIGIVVPMAIGMAINHFAPGFSGRVAGILGNIGFILLMLAVLPILIGSLPTIWSLIGNGAVFIFVIFATVGIVVGHFLGGSDPTERGVLAVATASRHPAVAIGLTAANIDEHNKQLAVAAILLYFVLAAIAVVPYIKLMKHYTGKQAVGFS
jgi:BASS family bile acid:Na+ symporter